MDQTDEEAPVPFGVNADSGMPLNALTDEVINELLGRKPEPTPESLALSSRVDPANISFATEGHVDPSDLGQAGWGVIYAPSVNQAVKDALSPLIEHRKAQAQRFFKIFDGSHGYRPGDTANDWLKRRNVRMDVVDPEKGVPFYLLLVGPPDELPFEFQYSLDIYWAVGRLWFETADEFRRYAESVVRYETSASVPTSRHGAIFATEHDFDDATQLFMRQVVKPLAEGENGAATAWQREKFGLQTLLGEQASKAALIEVLRSQAKPTPALLVTGSHGMKFSLGDERQPNAQGAIVCQSWARGSMKADDWLAAADVPEDAKLQGMMHFFFACYGGGCTEFDDYDRLNKAPKRIAEKPFLARLPQRMLAHPDGGALAVLAHVERAWAYSFQGQRGGSQVQGFRDVIGRLLHGQRIGQATDMFNLRWAAIATELSDMQADAAKGVEVPLRRLGNLWVSRDDARNFVVLGDPAVRLRVEDMPPA